LFKDGTGTLISNSIVKMVTGSTAGDSSGTLITNISGFSTPNLMDYSIMTSDTTKSNPNSESFIKPTSVNNNTELYLPSETSSPSFIKSQSSNTIGSVETLSNFTTVQQSQMIINSPINSINETKSQIQKGFVEPTPTVTETKNIFTSQNHDLKTKGSPTATENLETNINSITDTSQATTTEMVSEVNSFNSLPGFVDETVLNQLITEIPKPEVGLTTEIEYQESKQVTESGRILESIFSNISEGVSNFSVESTSATPTVGDGFETSTETNSKLTGLDSENIAINSVPNTSPILFNDNYGSDTGFKTETPETIFPQQYTPVGFTKMSENTVNNNKNSNLPASDELTQEKGMILSMGKVSKGPDQKLGKYSRYLQYFPCKKGFLIS